MKVRKNYKNSDLDHIYFENTNRIHHFEGFLNIYDE